MAEKRLRLLSLDGGGVRGLASLYMLKQLLSHFGDEMPCDFFDMIAGTSTGGLTAIMLGVMEMSVDECIEAFVSLMDTIFEKRHKVPFTVTGNVRPQYDEKKLEKAIRQVLRRQGLSEDALMRSTQTPRCHTFVVALSGTSSNRVHFTNYRKVGEQSDIYNRVKIWEAARATSAATAFFAPMTIDGNEGAQRNVIQYRTAAYGDDWEEKDKVEKFREVAGSEPKHISIPSNIRQIPTRLFYSLDDRPEHFRPGVSSYWQHLTLPAYAIYQRIADDCQARSKHPHGKVYFQTFLQVFNPTRSCPQAVTAVWDRLLRDKSDVQSSHHPVAFVMAVLYMLHVEQVDRGSVPKDLDGPIEDRRESLKRYDH
ncbi:hypothetical protein LTR08_002124 [Meristemomyces frigidus]|nr:hypothetical protein LTR08_002124 [Meristemomyces frigidus]